MRHFLIVMLLVLSTNSANCESPAPSTTVQAEQEVTLHVTIGEVSHARVRVAEPTIRGLDATLMSTAGLGAALDASKQNFGPHGTLQMMERSGQRMQMGEHKVYFHVFEHAELLSEITQALKDTDVFNIQLETVSTTTSGRPAIVRAFGEIQTRLDCVPTVLNDSRVRLEVRTTSSPIQNQTISADRTPDVGERQRLVDTAIELRFGQTLVLAGLPQVPTKRETQHAVASESRSANHGTTETVIIIRAESPGSKLAVRNGQETQQNRR